MILERLPDCLLRHVFGFIGVRDYFSFALICSRWRGTLKKLGLLHFQVSRTLQHYFQENWSTFLLLWKTNAGLNQVYLTGSLLLWALLEENRGTRETLWVPRDHDILFADVVMDRQETHKLLAPFCCEQLADPDYAENTLQGLPHRTVRVFDVKYNGVQVQVIRICESARSYVKEYDFEFLCNLWTPTSLYVDRIDSLVTRRSYQHEAARYEYALHGPPRIRESLPMSAISRLEARLKRTKERTNRYIARGFRILSYLEYSNAKWIYRNLTHQWLTPEGGDEKKLKYHNHKRKN